MKTDGLQLQHLPPLKIPFRFFISAPIFGVLSALLLLGGGTDIWASRWVPEIMAATHLLTLGFMATVMVGALFQVLPVLSGHAIPGQRWLAPMVHLLLATGTLALCATFIWQANGLRLSAIVLLGTGFGLFISALGLRLIKPDGGGDSILAIRLALLALLMTVSLGILMLSLHLGIQFPRYLHDASNLHLRFGLLGWVLLLIMGVSYQIIPMFHVTPDYAGYIRKIMPCGIFAALLILAFSSDSWLYLTGVGLLFGTASGYALFSLRLLQQRKRKIADYTTRFWQLGLSCLLLAILIYGLLLLNGTEMVAAYELLWGVLIIPGFALSIIIGVLHKIAPFLGWLHMQQACANDPPAMLKLPTMHELLPVGRGRIQVRLHCLSLALLSGATLVPAIGPLAALSLVADFAWLEMSLLKVLRTYQQSTHTSSQIVRRATS